MVSGSAELLTSVVAGHLRADPTFRRVDESLFDLFNREGSMAEVALTNEVLELIAERFKALAEPARLHILSALRSGEKTVTQLMEDTGLGQANASKHLQLLHALGFVERRKDGLYVHYRLADDSVFDLCDIMCGKLVEEARLRGEILSR
jgi:DNA-binding transcriptional ArsR family regulator